MRSVLSFLPALLCGVVMYVCVRSMSRSHSTGHDVPKNETERRLEEVEQELARLRAERELQRGDDDHAVEV